MLNDSSLCKTNQKLEVINLGVEGYDIEYSVHRFKVRGKKYNPDLILWLLRNGDFTVINELIKPKMDQYMKDMNSNQALLTQLQREGNFYPWSTKAAQDIKTELGEEGVLAYNKKALWRMNDYYKGRLVFITISGKSSLTDPHFSMLRSFSQARGNTYIYDGLSDNYDHFTDRHPTGKGYAQIAVEIFDYLRQNRLVPCSPF